MKAQGEMEAEGPKWNPVANEKNINNKRGCV